MNVGGMLLKNNFGHSDEIAPAAATGKASANRGWYHIIGSATMKIPCDVRGAIMSENPLMELLYGKGAHASPLACVEDLSGELAGSAVNGFPHTIWQILRHLNYW